MSREKNDDLRVKPLQAFALAHADRRRAGYDARIKGGHSRCDIFWTRSEAVKAGANDPDCQVVRVVVNQVFP